MQKENEFLKKQPHSLRMKSINGLSIKGYLLRNHMKETMVIDSLLDAVKKENPQFGLTVHTDQEAQHTGSASRELL